MLRFSNRLATRFHKVARSLERMREVFVKKRIESAEAKEPLDTEITLREIASELMQHPIDPPRCNACSLRLQTVEESCPRCMKKGQILRHILHLLRPHRRSAIFLCVLTILGVVAELIPPKLQQYMVDHILNGQAVGGLSNDSEVPFHSALLVVVLALAFSRILMSIVFSLGGLIVWYVGGRDVIGKEMTLGELIAFLAYLAMFYAPLGALSNFTSWLTSFLSGSKKVLELMDTPLGIQDPAHAKKWEHPRGHLRFDHVTFGYDRNQPGAGPFHRTELWRNGTCIADSVFAVSSFPATQPDRYLSLRRWKDHGEDEEVGMISNVSEWSEEQQTIFNAMTKRRYLLRKIQSVAQVKLRLGFLEFDVVTDLGREVFSMRWTQSQAIDFGDRGKLLMDTEENRHVA